MLEESRKRNPKPESILSLTKVLNCSLGKETDAALHEFQKIWNSSEPIRLGISQFLNQQKLPPQEAHPSKAGYNKSKIETRTTSNHKTTEALIRNGHVSPEKIEKGVSLSYGGLNRKKILLLLEKHKAGNRNLGTYLLVRAWKRRKNTPKATKFRLRRLTLESFEQAMSENRSDFFREIADTIDFLHQEEYQENGNWDHDPGQWWQFHLLHYILERPKDKYPIREFVKHFKEEVGTNEMPTAKTIRSFCRKNGIVLDSKPGAPKKKA